MRDAAPAVAAATSAGAAGIPFTLGDGDSVGSLSKKFGVPVSAILAANGLSSASEVKPGQKILLPVNATAKAVTPTVPRLMPGGKPVKPLASVETVGQPEFLFQSGAPFSARAAQIPLDAGSPAMLANADESEAAKLRKKLKQLQQEVDALEAAETKKKPSAKAKSTEKAATAEAETKPAKKKEPELAISDAPVKLKPKKKPAAEIADAETLKVTPKAKAKVKSVALDDEPVARKPAAGKKKSEPDTAIAEKATGKPKVAAKSKSAEKDKLAEKAPAKPKAEKLAKADTKVTEKPKKVRVIPTVPSKQVDAEPSAVVAPSADDALTTANVRPVEPVDPGFRWPAKGRVIQGFDGGANRGVKIAMPEGTSVKAARAGKVIYVGEEVKGYGKLVLVRHEDGYVSAYGNNSELKVKRGDEVGRGQEVARSGATGDVSSPMLHFELRKGAEAVNPLSYLK